MFVGCWAQRAQGWRTFAGERTRFSAVRPRRVLQAMRGQQVGCVMRARPCSQLACTIHCTCAGLAGAGAGLGSSWRWIGVARASWRWVGRSWRWVGLELALDWGSAAAARAPDMTGATSTAVLDAPAHGATSTAVLDAPAQWRARAR
jgi:hypothetical protein